MKSKSSIGTYSSAIASAAGLQGRIMWCDAEANMWELSSVDGVHNTVQLCKEANINTIIVDVKPLAGVVLYNSRIAPKLREWDGRPYPEDYDLLQTMVEECRTVGIAVYAAVNVFSEASQARSDGPALKNPQWQCMKYEIDDQGNARFVRVADSSAEHLAVFINPVLPEPRAYELSVIEEILRNYDVDGIVLDRMRYPNIYSDFSDFSRQEFEKRLGEKVERWPEDIFRISRDRKIEHGKLFREWLEWRSGVIKSFLQDVRQVVESVGTAKKLGVYVGSWYSEYYDVGVNWGSPEYRPPYEWATDTYNQTGYADLVDFLCTGCYYENATREDARVRCANEEATVEAAGETSVDVVMDETFVYGSLYVLQYATKPTDFIKAIKASLASTQGIMIFDLCYIRDYNWWGVLRNIFESPARPPHEVPGLSRQVKETRHLIESLE